MISVFSGAVLTRILAMLAFAALILSGTKAEAQELRGVWVDAWGAGFRNQAEVDTLLGVPGNANSIGTVRQGNHNAVFVQVRRRADVCYPSALGEPYFTGLSPSNFNALQAIINAAHDTTGGKQRIEVHAWIVTFTTTSSGSSPRAGSIYYDHDDPNDVANYWPTLNSTGDETDEKALDPGHPAVNQYINDVVMDLVSNFDIDGVHYDYIRFTANNQGYNPTSIARYNTKYGTSGQPSASTETFKQWRRDQVTALVRKTYANIQAVKPWVKQTAAVVTWNPSPTSSTRSAFQNTSPYSSVFADWDGWMQEGILDASVPMTYYDQSSLPNDYQRWLNFQKDRKANRHNYPGPGIYLNTLSDALLQISKTRETSPNGNTAQGFVGYSYRVPYDGGNWAGFYPSFVNQLGPTKVTVPDMPWKTSPTKGHIKGTVTFASDGSWADGATVTLTGPESRTQTADGTGFYAFIDLTPGLYTVTANKGGFNLAYQVNVQLGQVTGNMHSRNFALGANIPPVISNLTVTDVTNSTARVNWTTDQPATSRVEYGLSPSYSQSTTQDNILKTTHSRLLGGMQSNSLYNFRCISTNTNGTATTSNQTFTTSGPPTISGVASSSITATSATITWTTNAPATSQINYGTTPAYGQQSPIDANNKTLHTVVLSGLLPDTTYNYQALSTNAYGSAQSVNLTFTTGGPPTISNVVVSGITSSSATITWTTDLPSNSQVEYGTTTGYGSFSTLDSAEVTSHSITINGLLPNTLYNFRARSASTGGTGLSSNQTFTTLPTVSELIVDNLDAGFAYIKGTWVVATPSSKYGANYFYTTEVSGTSEASATHQARWTPTIPASGYWDVYIWYASGTNRSTNTYWKIVNAGATREIRVNQELPGNGWTLISSNVPFLSGTNGYVELGNNTGITGTSQIVHGDAVRFVYKGGDIEAPSVPQNLTAVAASTTSVQLNWSPSGDNVGVNQYRIFRNGVQVASSATNSYLDTNLTANTSYTYAVAARDTAGNQSGNSLSVARATLSIPPTSALITCNRTTGAWYGTNGFSFTAVGGFGASRVQSYRFIATTSDTHTFTGSETTWAVTGAIGLSVPGEGSYWFHFQGLNPDNVPNGVYSFGPFNYDASAPVMGVVGDDKYTASTSELNVTWSATDPQSGIQKYEYSVGSDAGLTDVLNWTDAGTSTSANITGLSLTLEQTYFVNVRAKNNAGQTGTAASSAGVTIAHAVQTIGQAKAFADGTPVILPAKPVTGVWPTFFYIAETDRSSGIRVDGASALTTGTLAAPAGRIALVSDCERMLSDVKVTTQGSMTPLKPLTFQHKQLVSQKLNDFTPGMKDGIGLNNVGLPLRSIGKVLAVESDRFFMDDGSALTDGDGNTGILVLTGSAPTVTVGTWVEVVGLSSARSSGLDCYPLIRALAVTAL